MFKKFIFEQKGIYHFILIDVDMPEMNGSQLCKLIRDFEI